VNLQRILAATATLLGWTLLPNAQGGGDFHGSTHMVPFEEGALNYNKAKANDPITGLQARINGGEAAFQFSQENGYLDSVLAELKIPKSSQVLVFSKTSFQRERIFPATPRALFFNDDVYIGFIPDSPMIEVS